jgi:hypothetical protein
MDREENCFFCGKSDGDARLVGWFVQAERRTIHMPCWLAAYRSDNPGSESSSSTPYRSAERIPSPIW